MSIRTNTKWRILLLSVSIIMNVRIIPFILQAATENLTSHFFSSKLFYQLTSALFLLFVPWRLWKLNGRQTKTIPSPIYMVKLVSSLMHIPVTGLDLMMALDGCPWNSRRSACTSSALGEDTTADKCISPGICSRTCSFSYTGNTDDI